MEAGIISVDRWSSGSQAYFLTHLHADHTSGLTPRWKWGPLFCSRVTAKLFPLKFPGFNLSLLRVLDVGRWYSLPLFSPSSGLPITVQVLVIDAHHCPGAVMYLFRGEFGSMLCTGDFRWEKGSQRARTARAMLLNALKTERLDILYLDNTYCNPSYSFPCREVAAKKIIDIISAHPNHDIVIGVDSLGKEELLLYISRQLKIKIWVWPERLQTMHLLGLPDVFTTKTSLTRVRAIPRYSFSIETLEGLNTMRPTIGIMPSGLPWAAKSVKGNGSMYGGSPLVSSRSKSTSKIYHPNCPKGNMGRGNMAASFKSSEHIYSIPYSDHSCFAELKEFVELLQPINVKGIVSSSPCYIDPMYYFADFCGMKGESRRTCQNLLNEDEGEIIQAIPMKNPVRVKCILSGSKRKSKQGDYLGSHVNRVTLLRRLTRGVKISETDYPALTVRDVHDQPATLQTCRNARAVSCQEIR